LWRSTLKRSIHALVDDSSRDLRLDPLVQDWIAFSSTNGVIRRGDHDIRPPLKPLT